MNPHGELPPLSCLPWPVPEPPLDPEDLHDEIDWSTFSHEELYEMATGGLDLEGANEVAAQWSRLGARLEEIGADLRGALELVADAWQGAAAEHTRDTLGRLVNWTRDTADASTEVCGCVTEQAALAAAAARDMPEPTLTVTPTDQLASPDRSFAGAEGLVDDPVPDRERTIASQRQAADVMRRYQEQARQVYTRVPAFADPDGVRIESEPGDPGSGGEPDEGTTASSVAGSAGGFAAGAAAVLGAPAVGGSDGAPAPPTHGPGSGAGQAAAPERASSATQVGGRGGVGMGGAPMGAGGSRQREEDAEHRTPSYLQEDADDIWTDSAPVPPPVIGEGPNYGDSR